jgi:hypothetical protein
MPTVYVQRWEDHHDDAGISVHGTKLALDRYLSKMPNDRVGLHPYGEYFTAETTDDHYLEVLNNGGTLRYNTPEDYPGDWPLSPNQRVWIQRFDVREQVTKTDYQTTLTQAMGNVIDQRLIGPSAHSNEYQLVLQFAHGGELVISIDQTGRTPQLTLNGRTYPKW